MAVSHVFSSPVADFTGTVTVFDSNGQTATTNATALVRPSNWNSVHNQFMTISGNTAGASTASGTNLVLQGGNNVTLSVTDQTIIFSASQSQSVQTQNMVSVLGSTGNISFANGNGVTFGGNASTITASHNGLTSQSNQAFSAPGGSSAFQTLVFANSQGVSWSNSNGSVVASVATNYAASDHSHGNPTLALTNLSGTTASNSAGLTLSLSAANPGGGAAFSAGISGGNTSGDTGTVSNQIVFAGGNNITVSGSTNAGGMSVTISGANAGGAQTGISGIIVSDTTYTSGTVSFSNANGITFGSSAGQAITASHNALTSQSNQAVSAANGSYAFQTLSFSNANGLSFGTSAGSAITASYTVPTQTNQTGGIYFTAQTTGQSSSSTYDLRTLSVVGDGIVSAGWSNGTVRISATQSNQAFSAGAASSTFQTLTFQDSNGLSFSNNGGAIRVSYTTPVVSNAIQSVGSATGSGTNTSRFAADDHVHAGVFSMGVSTGGNTAGDTRVDVGRFVLVGGNNITLSQGTAANGLNTITISAGAGGGVNTGTFYATGNTTRSSTGTIALSSIIINGSGGVSAGISNGSVIVHGPDLTSLSVTGALSASSNGSTISLGVGTVTASATSNTTQGSSGTINLNGLIFQGAGAASVGISNGSVVISAPNAGAGNVTFSAGANSAGLASVVFSNSNGVSFGLNGSTITASAAGGGGGVGLGVSTMGNTAGTTGTVTTGNVALVGSGVVSLSQSSSGSNATISILAPATSSLVGASGISISTNGSTISVYNPPMSGFNPYADIEKQAGQYGQASLQFDPVRAPNFVMDRIVLPLINTNSSNSSGSHTLSFWVGLYSRNASTLSLVFSASSSTALTHSGTGGSYSLYSGNRLFTIAASQTITQGDYWVGFVSRTTSGGANGSYSNLIASNIASNFLGYFGSSHNTTVQLTLGQGVYTATTSGIPGSVAFSQIRGSDSQARRAAFIMFANSTV